MSSESSWDEARLHLLATVMSPRLREHLMSTATTDERANDEYAVKLPKNKDLASEMQSLSRDAPRLISKRTEAGSDTACTVSDVAMQAVESIHREAKTDRAECEKRLAKRQRFLQSMLLYDIVGSART